jgi:Cu-Zn family superoxide dismutase
LALAALAAPVAFAQTAATVSAASAVLRDASGRTVGTAVFTQQANGVRLAVQVQGLPPGQHGIHVHAVGRCDAPDFMTAGGHFNPASRQHGLENPQGPHAGDLQNLAVAANGNGSFNMVDTMVALGSGANSLFGSDGTALVIHADMDDERTDPAGNSGARIACGVIVRGAAALPNTGGGARLLGAPTSLLSPLAGGITLAVAGVLGLLRYRFR